MKNNTGENTAAPGSAKPTATAETPLTGNV